MSFPIRRFIDQQRWHAEKVAAAVILAVTALTITAPAAQADTYANGVKVTIEDEPGLAGPLTVTLESARKLALRCTYTSDRVVLFIDGRTAGDVLPVRCSKLYNLHIVGSSGADNVSVDLRRTYIMAKRSVTVFLGDGDDIATVRAAGDGDITMRGEAGNDQLRSYLTSGSRYRGEFTTAALDGGPGDDVVRHDGFTGVAEPGDDGSLMAVGLTGGPGADRLIGPDDSVPTWYTVDNSDVRIRWSPVVTGVSVGVFGTADVNLRGTETWVTPSYNQARIWLPARVQVVNPYPEASGTGLTVRGKSSQTGVRLVSSTRADAILRPYRPYTWDQASKTVSQPGAKPWTYDGAWSIALVPRAWDAIAPS